MKFIREKKVEEQCPELNRARVTCFLCNREGRLYYRIRKSNKNSNNFWTYYYCHDCQHLWLHPIPEEKDLNQAYENYHTHYLSLKSHLAHSLRQKWLKAFVGTNLGYDFLIHESGLFFRILGRTTSLIPGLRRRALLAVNGVRGMKNGYLLDIGCGNGLFLRKMADLGWKVLGVEPDAKAAEIASRHFGLKVITSKLEEVNLPESSFDAITLRHSLEHIPNPLNLFRACFRLLRPGGKIYILTPNGKSFGHRIFAQRWRGLEPPRHLHVFSLFSLRTSLQHSGFQIISAWTTARSAPFFWGESSRLGYKPIRALMGRMFQLLEVWLMSLKIAEGEEILIEGLKV